MAINKDNDNPGGEGNRVSSSVESLLLAALERGGDSFQTGRYLVTFTEGTDEEARKLLGTTLGMRIADARDFDAQAATLESIGDADAVIFPAICAALIGGDAAQTRNLSSRPEFSGGPFNSIEPEYFAFTETGSATDAQNSSAADSENTAVESLHPFTPSTRHRTPADYLRSFLRAAEMITREVRQGNGHAQTESQKEAQVAGVTWGLKSCNVPYSAQSGDGIGLAVLDTGLDLGHPDFAGRLVTSNSFVGEPVQDLNGHGTHITGTACGPEVPAGKVYRYGIASRASIYSGKVLTNAGSGTMGSVLAGINWALANRCPVILLPLAIPGGPFRVFTAAGQAALHNGCLMIAGSASTGFSVDAPANSPTVLSVAPLDRQLKPASFSPVGKIDIAAPGIDTLSSFPRPHVHKTWGGSISAATAHVAGCACLWAETVPGLRGLSLWKNLVSTARHLSLPATQVGAGLVQAP